jgi:hypothetical protein
MSKEIKHTFCVSTKIDNSQIIYCKDGGLLIIHFEYNFYSCQLTRDIKLTFKDFLLSTKIDSILIRLNSQYFINSGSRIDSRTLSKIEKLLTDYKADLIQ